MSKTVVKWISLPALLTGALFAPIAGRYEIRYREYLWAARFADTAIVFSPLTLAVKTFLLLSFTCVAALAGVHAAWKPQLVEAL